MDMKEEVERLERLAKAAGLSMRAACRNAGLPFSTFARWKNGSHAPVMTNLKKLQRAIEETTLS